jgi:hypothetical protein
VHSFEGSVFINIQFLGIMGIHSIVTTSVTVELCIVPVGSCNRIQRSTLLIPKLTIKRESVEGKLSHFFRLPFPPGSSRYLKE